jgi:hypothetical protein
MAAWEGVNHAPRSTSGITIHSFDRGGHSTSQVLLLSWAGSQSPSNDQAMTTLPVFCRTDPKARNGSLAMKPVPLGNSGAPAEGGNTIWPTRSMAMGHTG